MKRIALIALLLLGSLVGARADHDVYSSTSGHPRGDAVLQADTMNCTIMLAAPQNGVPTSATTRIACSAVADASVTRCTNARRVRISIPTPMSPA